MSQESSKLIEFTTDTKKSRKMIEILERRLKNNLLANRSAPFLYHNADGAGCQGRRSRAACSLYTEFGMVSPLPVPCKRSSDAPIPFGFRLSAARSHRTALPVVHRDVDARSIHIKSSGYNFHNGFLLKCFIVLLGCSFVLWRGG